MLNNIACLQDESPLRLAATMKFARSLCLGQGSEEQRIDSSFGDNYRNIWITQESSTSSALRLIGKLLVNIFQNPTSPVPEVDCGLLSDVEPFTASQQYFEQKDEIRFVPPEDSWHPIRVRLIKVKEFPLHLEP